MQTNDINIIISLFIIGLIGSSHCIGMCGSIQQILINISQKDKNISLYLYNLGRLTGYIILTALVSTFVFSFSKQTKNIIPVTDALRLLSGFVILYFGLKKVTKFRFNNRITNIGLSVWPKIRKLANPIMPPRSLLHVY